jgi:multimeric flavodoxin WrbA
MRNTDTIKLKKVLNMRVLGIVCSPRKEGNTEILVKEALKAAEEKGAETELILVSDMDITPCIACDSCLSEGNCVVEDDMQKIYESLEKADGIIFGTPVYFINVSAQAKAIIDRTYAFLISGRLKGKVAAVMAATRRVGGGHVLSLMYSFFSAHRMHIAGGAIGYGLGKGEVKEGPGASPFFTAMEEASALGKGVVKLGSQLS